MVVITWVDLMNFEFPTSSFTMSSGSDGLRRNYDYITVKTVELLCHVAQHPVQILSAYNPIAFLYVRFCVCARVHVHVYAVVCMCVLVCDLCLQLEQSLCDK